jgi:hypothetical protein
MLVRELTSEKFRGGGLEPKVAHRAYPDVTVQHGNHSVTLGRRRIVNAPSGTIQVLHFPVRSYAQWHLKITQGAAILDEHPDHPPWITAGWRYMREQHLRKDTLRAFFENLALEAPDLAGAPDRANLVIDTRVRDILRKSGRLLPPIPFATS